MKLSARGTEYMEFWREHSMHDTCQIRLFVEVEILL